MRSRDLCREFMTMREDASQSPIGNPRIRGLSDTAEEEAERSDEKYDHRNYESDHERDRVAQG